MERFEYEHEYEYEYDQEEGGPELLTEDAMVLWLSKPRRVPGERPLPTGRASGADADEVAVMGWCGVASSHPPTTSEQT
jgi:hypothetical protein